MISKKDYIEFTYHYYPDTYKLRPTGKWMIREKDGELTLYIQSHAWILTFLTTWVSEEDIQIDEWSETINEC